MSIFHKPLFIIFHVVLMYILPLIITSSPTTQVEALVKWKNTLLPYVSLNDWSLNNVQNLCNWTGITCSTAGTVSILDLTERGLTGSLAHFNFSSLLLKSFVLWANNFSGSIPDEIGLLCDIQFLDWSHNSFEGSIPSSVGQLRELQTLELGRNHLKVFRNFLTGPLPLSLSNLPQISELNLADNHLSGELSPHLISNWTELITMDISNNTLIGNIPPEIGMLTNLTYLYLSYNTLSGPIPGEIWKLTNLKGLSLSSNNLSETIPPEIGNSTQLNNLDLSKNHFNGELPDSISDLSYLRGLFLKSNRFSGSIPKDFGKYTPNLGYVDLSKNNLSVKLSKAYTRNFILD